MKWGIHRQGSLGRHACAYVPRSRPAQLGFRLALGIGERLQRADNPLPGTADGHPVKRVAGRLAVDRGRRSAEANGVGESPESCAGSVRETDTPSFSSWKMVRDTGFEPVTPTVSM